MDKMTIDDVMEKIDRFNTFDCSGTAWRNLRAAVEKLVAVQVAAEREACAAEVDKWIGQEGLAAAIRARGETT